MIRNAIAGLVIAGLAIVAATAPGTLAGWQAKETLNVGIVTTGDLSLNAHWSAGAPHPGALFPGQKADAHLKATIHGSGTNLRWKLQVAHKVDPAFKDHVTFQSWAGACGTGTSIQTNGYPSQGSMPPGQNVDICVRFTLNANAPSTLQGKTLGAKVVVTGLQAG